MPATIDVTSSGYGIFRFNGNTLSGSLEPSDLDWLLRTQRPLIVRAHAQRRTEILLMWLEELDRYGDSNLNYARADAAKFRQSLTAHALAPSIVRVAGQPDLQNGYYLSVRPI